MKTEIIERLGQADLLLPSLIAEGLAANARFGHLLRVSGPFDMNGRPASFRTPETFVQPLH